MKQIEPITWNVRKPNDGGLFHDTRGDIATTMKCIRLLIEKVNELVHAVNELRKEGVE